MEKWAKIFNVSGHQVLVTKDFDQDEDKPQLHFESRIQGTKCEISYTVDDIDSKFEQLDKFDARIALKEMLNLKKLTS